LLKQFNIAGEGNTGKVDFEKLGVAAAVGGGMKNSVDVIKDGFGVGLGQVSNLPQPEFGGEIFEEFG